jgi:hypothetical protein
MAKGGTPRDMHPSINLHLKTPRENEGMMGNLPGECVGNEKQLHLTSNVRILGNLSRDMERTEEGAVKNTTGNTSMQTVLPTDQT